MIRVIFWALMLVMMLVPSQANDGAVRVAIGPAPLAQSYVADRPTLLTQVQTRKLMCSSTVACPQGYFCCPGFSSVSLCCPNGRTCNYGKFRCD